jgi:endonuclease-3
MMELPGVGSKTASIVLAYGFGIPTIAVDTHVNRISQRLGLVEEGSKPEETQKVLERMVPRRMQVLVNHLFVSFGKDVCKPLRPQCFRCPIKEYCRYYHRSGQKGISTVES